jgi:hypothetical protein
MSAQDTAELMVMAIVTVPDTVAPLAGAVIVAALLDVGVGDGLGPDDGAGAGLGLGVGDEEF